MKALLTYVRVTFDAIADAIMPPKARTERVRSLTLERVPLQPNEHDLLGVRITTLMDYRVQEAQDLIQALKYDGRSRAAALIADVLADFLHEELSSERLFSQKDVLLIPVPLHPSRQRERGFNQIDAVLAHVPQEYRDGTKARIADNVLVRARATKPQTRLSRTERLSNVAGAFALAENADVKDKRIFLIDDVTTTGATLANAAQPLRRAGAEVTLLALARA